MRGMSWWYQGNLFMQMREELRKSDICVVIPIYKEHINELEQISLNQVMSVLFDYEIIFAMPEGLQFDYDCNYSREYFSTRYFESIHTYNELLTKNVFYRRFERFRYILIYQLDAFVFEDRLLYFCKLGYDYIGAPWLYGHNYYLDCEHMIWHVGNGGLSLRNVNKCMELIENSQTFLSTYKGYEDIFFGISNSENFKVAPTEIALAFSFETEVKKCFDLNEKKLPFGCHAWEKYDLEFWKPYIEQYGYTISEEYLAEGNRDVCNENMYEVWHKESFFWENVYKKENIKKNLCNNGKKIYIWGAGERGSFLGKLLLEADIIVEGYIDNNKELAGTYIGNYCVYSNIEFERYRKECFFIIAIDKYKDDVAQQLHKIGCNYMEDFIFYSDIFARMK